MAEKTAGARQPLHTMAKTKQAGRGRPILYKTAYAEQSAKLAALGLTDVEIADFFGVSVRTIHRWKSAHPEFCHSLKAAKDVADDRVERSLYARAVGYEHDEVDIRVVDHEIVQTVVRKFYAPETAACIFWLKNRRGQEWRADNPPSGDGADKLNLQVNIYGGLPDEDPAPS